VADAPRVRATVVVLTLLAGAVGVLAKRSDHENVHRPDADCAGCHTADAATLRSDPAAARNLLVPDLEERCLVCHDDEGPSHHTGIRPRKPVPADLPLSRDGVIVCATCHFMHGEQNPFGDFVRIDNSRGGLCLTCHELRELQ
jgi:hypothetical protein